MSKLQVRISRTLAGEETADRSGPKDEVIN